MNKFSSLLRSTQQTNFNIGTRLILNQGTGYVVAGDVNAFKTVSNVRGNINYLYNLLHFVQ